MIKITKDGRIIRTGPDYTKFRRSLHRWQDSLCAWCEKFTDLEEPIESDRSFHVHHPNGRGMGGGKRDDDALICVGVCGECHRKEHNQ